MRSSPDELHYWDREAKPWTGEWVSSFLVDPVKGPVILPIKEAGMHTVYTPNAKRYVLMYRTCGPPGAIFSHGRSKPTYGLHPQR